MQRNDLLIKELSDIRAELLAAANPYRLDDNEKKDLSLVLNTLTFIVKNIDRKEDPLKAKKGTYLPSDPGDTERSQLAKYVWIHFEQVRSQAEKALAEEFKQMRNQSLTEAQKEARIQDAVKYLLVGSIAELFVQSIKELKTYQAKLVEAKVHSDNVIKTFCQKLSGVCIDARTRGAFQYALTITDGPRFTDLFGIAITGVPNHFKLSYFLMYVSILNKNLGKSFREDVERKGEKRICDRDGIFCADGFVSGLVRKLLAEYVQLDPLVPEVASAQYPNDPTKFMKEDPYKHFMAAYDFAGANCQYLVDFLLSHGAEFVEKFLKDFEGSLIRQKYPKLQLVFDFALRVGKLEWIMNYGASNTIIIELLRIAADKQDWQTFMILIKCSPDISSLLKLKDKDGFTPMQIAARACVWDCVSDIFDLQPNDAKEEACYGSAVVRAARARQWPLVRKLSEGGAAIDWTMQDNNYYALHYAILENLVPDMEVKKQEETIVELLISKGAPINAQAINAYLFKPTPLHVAAEKKEVQLKTLQWLLRQTTIKVNVKNEKGETALALAVASGDIAKAKLLLEHPDTDIEIKRNNGKSAISLAEASENNEMKALFNSTFVKMKRIKAKINLANYPEAAQILSTIYAQSPEEFRDCILELQKLADIIVDNKNLYTQLINSLLPLLAKSLIEVNDLQTMSLLLQLYDAETLDAQQHDGQTLLHLSIQLNRPEMGKCFLDLGASITARNKNRMTCLEFAAVTKNWDLMKQMVFYGGFRIAAEYFAAREGNWELFEEFHNTNFSFDITALHTALLNNDLKTAAKISELKPFLLSEIIEIDNDLKATTPIVKVRHPLLYAAEVKEINAQTFSWMLDQLEQSAIYKSDLHRMCMIGLVAAAEKSGCPQKIKLAQQKQQLHSLLHRLAQNDIQAKEDTRCLDNPEEVKKALACMHGLFPSEIVERVKFITDEYNNEKKETQCNQYRFFDSSKENKGDAKPLINYAWYDAAFKLAHHSKEKGDNYKKRQGRIRGRAFNLFKENLSGRNPDEQIRCLTEASLHLIFNAHRAREIYKKLGKVNTLDRLEKMKAALIKANASPR